MQSRNPTTSRGGIFCCRLPYYTRRSAAGRFVGSGLDRSAGRQKNASLPYCVCRGDHWSPANLPPQRIFRDSFLARQTGTGEQCSPLQAFFGSSAEGSRSLPTEQKEKSASKETCPGEINPAPAPLYAFHSSLFSGAHHAPNSKAVSTTKGRACGKNQSRRDQPSGRGAKRRRQQHHRAPMAAHL